MKAYILLSVILLFGCGTSGNQTQLAVVESVAPVSNSTTPTLNPDSLKRIEADTKKHFLLVSQVFNDLKIDSLKADDGEAYRLIIRRETSRDDMGNPISITFYKKKNKSHFEIREIFTSKDNSVKTKTRTTPVASFDSISNMFGQYFWEHDITDFNCDQLMINGKISFYESFKNGKHKLITQTNCKDKELLPLAYFNFFIFSEYNDVMVKDFMWFKENPPNNIKTPGPPSSLKK